MTGGMLTQQNDTLDIIRLAHAAGKPVVVGGPDVTSSPHITLRQTSRYAVNPNASWISSSKPSIPMSIALFSGGETSGRYGARINDLAHALAGRLSRWDILLAFARHGYRASSSAALQMSRDWAALRSNRAWRRPAPTRVFRVPHWARARSESS